MKDFDSSDSSFGVYDTTKLTKMLSVLGNDVDFSINDIDGKVVFEIQRWFNISKLYVNLIYQLSLMYLI